MNRKGDLYRYHKYIESCGHKMVQNPEEADAILVWSCSFREDYKENSYKVLKECQEKYSGEVILCGCLSSIDPNGVQNKWNGKVISWKNQDQDMPKMFGDGEKNFHETPRTYGEIPIENIERFKNDHPEVKVVFHDQYIKLFISEGCSLNCTYCSDIRAFPKYKSFPLESLIREAKALIDFTGQKRFLFCGDSIGEYGREFGKTLMDLNHAILAIDPEVQVGFNNINPLHLLNYLPAMIELFRQSRICFMDLPIQSADDRVLKLMGRGYNRQEIATLFGQINSTGFKELETDVLIGFPTESEDEFKRTVDFLCEYKPKYVQVSAFMPVTGSKAFDMTGQIDPTITAQRLAILKETLTKEGILYDKGGSNVVKDWPFLQVDSCACG